MGRIRIDPSSRMPYAGEPLEEPADAPAIPSSGSAYVELTVRSNFSFLQGASPPERLVQRAAALGFDAIAITDRDGLYGAVRAHEEARKQGVRLVLGAELTIEQGSAFTTLTVLVADHEGYTNLCRILTASHARHAERKRKARKTAEGLPKNVYAGVATEIVCAHAAGLWALVHGGAPDAPATLAHVGLVKEAFGARASVALHRHLDGEDRARSRDAIAIATRFELPLVATNAIRHSERAEKPILDILHCIREGTTLDKAGRALLPNAEACLKPDAEMRRIFRDRPDAIERSRVIADACRFSLTELKYRFPCELERPAYEGETPDAALRRMTYEGAAQRYGEGDGDAIPAKVRGQIEKELGLIARLEVAPYFLSVRTIVDMARRRDILCQGRGSAANSAVCFCLGITAVDPARSNLLFERFLSAERHEPPDIDVDFEHDRREEVIQEIYEKYGRDRAAMVSEVVSYRGKSALKEVGKVFGLSLEQTERLSGTVSWFDPVREVDPQRLAAAGFDAKDPRVRMVIEGAFAIQGFPRHLSIHVGGFVLSAEPLDRVAPIEPATMPNRTVIPWDKDDLDTLGFFKVDVLALGILTAIRKALAMASETDARVAASTAIDRLARIPAEDPEVYEALCHADTVGVFQIESRAQMSMLPRLQPRNYYDLVVEVAIVRPGPIQGGMIHPYLRRRNGQEDAVAPHPILAPILDRTLGVPLFQEQVMQIAIVGAGYTGGEADQLRRDMAAWKKNGRLERHRERLLHGFAARGISLEFGERLYAQIQGFGEYGFPESHSASFALLVYASSWLKVHHPAAFAASLVNSQPMGFYSPSTILQDAQRHGVVVRPICIVASDWDCTLERQQSIERDDSPCPSCASAAARGNRRARCDLCEGKKDRHVPRPSLTEPQIALRVGLRQVKGLGEDSGQRIVAARKERAFTSIEDVAARADLSALELEALAEAGVFDPFIAAPSAHARRVALWKVLVPRGEGLFAGIDASGEVPAGLLPLTRAEQLSLDYERTGLSVSDHPMRILRPGLGRAIKSSTELQRAIHGRRISVAGLVICRQRPATASGVVFITMEDEDGFLNLILYARVFEALRHVATTSTLLVAHGKVEREGEVVYVVVERLENLGVKGGAPIVGMSRDFH
jgi:error-prone DNA polymerase